MRILPPEILTARQARKGVDAHSLVYFWPKNRATGEIEEAGLWTGADDRSFNINVSGGVDSRVYRGRGGVLNVPNITSRIGIEVRRYQIVFSAISLEVRQGVRSYDPRFAPIEVHRAEFDTYTGDLLAAPERKMRGWIDGVEWSEAGDNGQFTVTLNCVSSARALTRTLATVFGDGSQKLRDPSDNYYRYADISGSMDVWWGEQRAVSKEKLHSIAQSIFSGRKKS